MFSNNSNVLITGGTYVHVAGVRKEFDILQQHICIGAMHDSGERFNPPRCHPETRGVLLAEIMEWVTKSPRDSFLLWLHGPFGSGKSALAQSIAEQCQVRGLLAASFFFSRMSPERSHEKHLVATIAYQLALALPDARGGIEDAVQRDPLVFGRALQTQFQKLVVGPLCSLLSDDASERDTKWPRLVIIDALDECRDPKVQRYILSVISEEFQRHPSLPLLFIITSRPEEHIRMSFTIGNLGHISSRLSLQDYLGSYDDIRVFLQMKFEEIKEEHPLRDYIPPSWPTPDIISSIVRKSSGQFVYAATVIEYVSSLHHRPTEQLDVVLGLSNAEGDTPFSELDALYKHIFESSVVNVQRALRVLSAVILMEIKVTPEMLESLFFLGPGDVQLYLSGLSSVVSFQDHNADIKVLHASLSDFLLDSKRSGRFHIESGKAHADLASCCLQHLEANKFLVLTQYACYNFESHLDVAEPTDELYDRMLKFNLVGFHKISGNYGSQQLSANGSTLSLEDIWYFVPTFSDCIQNSIIFPDAEDIYEHHLELFDEHLEAELDKYSGGERLIDLVTMLMVYHSPITVQNLDDVPMCKDILLQLAGAEHLILIDENALNLRHMVRRHSQSEPYIELLCQFLEDPDRSGRHFIDGHKYARAALRCLKYIGKPLDSDSSRQTFMWTLECAPPLLLQADYHAELVSFLSDNLIHQIPRQTQHSYYPTFGRMIKEARLAYLISTYLNDEHSMDPLSESHGRLEVVPQGLRIPRTSTKETGSTTTLQNLTVQLIGSQNVSELCCTHCVIKQYFNAEVKSRRGNSQMHIIVHVEDPFPELTPESISLDKGSEVTISGIMNILSYRVWKRLVVEEAEDEK